MQVGPERGLPQLPVAAFPCCVPHARELNRATAPLSPQDFLRCVTAALIYFAISITAVAKYPDGASKAAGVSCSPTSGKRGSPLTFTPLLSGFPF